MKKNFKNLWETGNEILLLRYDVSKGFEETFIDKGIITARYRNKVRYLVSFKSGNEKGLIDVTGRYSPFVGVEKVNDLWDLAFIDKETMEQFLTYDGIIDAISLWVEDGIYNEFNWKLKEIYKAIYNRDFELKI